MVKKNSNIMLPDQQRNGGKQNQTISGDISRALLSHSDVGLALNLVQEQAGLINDIEHGAEIEVLQREISELDKLCEESECVRKNIEKELDQTPKYIETAPVTNKGGSKEKVWSMSDKFKYWLLNIVGYGLTIAGGITVYVNLMASGNIEFIENPLIPAIMSTLVIGGSIALKVLGNQLPINRPQQIYKTTISAISALAFGTWAVLFAVNFSLSDGIDLDSMEGSSISALYTAVHLLAEVSIAAALLINADHIAQNYNPRISLRNWKYDDLKKKLIGHIKAHAELEKKCNKKHGCLKELLSKRQAYINAKSAAFTNMHTRYAQSNPDIF